MQAQLPRSEHWPESDYGQSARERPSPQQESVLCPLDG